MGRSGPASDIFGIGDYYETALEHHGVKGMHWGVHKAPTETAPAKTVRRAADSEDVKNVTKSQARIDVHGTRVLSNKELQDVISRINLEQRYVKAMEGTSALSGGQEAANYILGLIGTAQKVHSVADTPLGKIAAKGIKTASAAAKAAYLAKKVAKHPATKTVVGAALALI